MKSLALVLVLLLAVTAVAQDQWFVLDKFGGLNLLLEKTHLPPGTALTATNVVFNKIGTVSALSGLTNRASIVSASGYPILGLGNIDDYINDSDHVITACSTLFWNTYSNSWGTWVKSSAVATGTWQSWTDSVLWFDTLGLGRAAEFWRPGWRVLFNLSDSTYQYRTIDYILGNSHVFLTDAPDTNYISAAGARIFPILASTTAQVRFVHIEVGRKPMLLCLQAGMEPVLYDGKTLSSMRYFGIADSGFVQKVRQDTNGTGVAYITDNTKLGMYGNDELADKGYWLHFPYRWTNYDDTSHWGRVFPVDSNGIDTLTDSSVEYRIYFSPTYGDSGFPGGSWTDSVAGTRYSILSAPFGHEVVSSETDTAVFNSGGLYIQLDTGIVDLHTVDNVPHVLEVLADSLSLPRFDTIENCFNTGFPPKETCVTYYESRPGRVFVRGHLVRPAPIRTVMPDSVPDSVIIWTSGALPDLAFNNFSTDKWRIWKLSLPYASDGIVYNGRLYLGGDPESPNLIAFSDVNTTRGSQLGGFPAKNFLELPANGDEFTGFALIYDWLVIFQHRHTWLLKGDPEEGYSPVLALPNEGCIALNSITVLDNEVLFRSERGMRLFDGNSTRDFAEAIQPAIQALPRTSFKTSQSQRSKTVSAFDATTGNIWISAPFDTVSSNNGSFIFNRTDGSYSYSNEVYGGLIQSFSFLDTLWLVFTHPTKGKIYTYGYIDSLTPVGIDGDSMHIRWETGWLDFGASQELKYVEDGAFHVTAAAPTAGATRKLIVSMFKDRDTTAFYADTTNVISYITNKYYLSDNQLRLEPASEFQWLKIRIDAYGYSVLDFQRLALRWRPGADIVRDRSTVFRPESN